MNPTLFLKLVEKKLIAENTQLSVVYSTYHNLRKINSTQGQYSVVRLYSDSLRPGVYIEVKNSDEQVSITPNDIKLIEGKTPVKLAAEHGIRPDGNDNEAPKRRGRKPKVRAEEDELFEEEDDDNEDEDEEELVS